LLLDDPVPTIEAVNPKAKTIWRRARIDLAARMFSHRNFSEAHVVKCHPEPAAKDLAAAAFAAAICLVLVASRAQRSGTSSKQANRSARDAPSEILRRRLRMTPLFRPDFFSLWG
jgi:hypothetical protein